MERNQRIKGPALIFGEFLLSLRIWLLIAANPGTNGAEYFCETPIYLFGGCSIHLNQYMSENRFESICSALKFTSNLHPYFRDKLFEVQHMTNTWNYHLQRVFIPFCISCLDESMSSWINKFACLGFFFCPHKPHKKGNEYHTICCGESGIM